MDDTVEYARVMIIIRRGNEEVTYDLPKVDNVVVETKYEEPDIRADWKRIQTAPKIERFNVSMRPLQVNEGTCESHYFIITRTNHGVERTVE